MKEHRALLAQRNNPHLCSDDPPIHTGQEPAACRASPFYSQADQHIGNLHPSDRCGYNAPASVCSAPRLQYHQRFDHPGCHRRCLPLLRRQTPGWLYWPGWAYPRLGADHRSGKITKTDWRDLRAALVEATHTATNTHPHRQAELKRHEHRIGHNKAIVAIARNLLVAIWNTLTFQVADIHAQPVLVARKLMSAAYKLGRANRPSHLSSAASVRSQLDQLKLGRDLSHIPWDAKKMTIPLPPSSHSSNPA